MFGLHTTKTAKASELMLRRGDVVKDTLVLADVDIRGVTFDRCELKVVADNVTIADCQMLGVEPIPFTPELAAESLRQLTFECQ